MRGRLRVRAFHDGGAPIMCLFDPRSMTAARARKHEIIDPTHPLILWIRHKYETKDYRLYPVSAIRLRATEAPVEVGDYAFVVHRWSFRGLRSDHVLMYSTVSMGGGTPLPLMLSETLILAAANFGNAFSKCS